MTAEKRSLLLGLVVGCLLLFLLLVAALGAGVWFLCLRQTPTLEASLDLPLEATVGDPIPMVVTTNNPHSRPVVLDSIDVSDNFLNGFQVLAIQPKPANTMHIAAGGYRTWSFGKSVPAGEVLAVTFTLRPIGPGRFAGDVDVCNPNQDYVTLLADVVVRGE